MCEDPIDFGGEGPVVVMGLGVLMVIFGGADAMMRADTAVATLDDTAFHRGDLGCEAGSRFGDLGFQFLEFRVDKVMCVAQTRWHCTFFVLARVRSVVRDRRDR